MYTTHQSACEICGRSPKDGASIHMHFGLTLALCERHIDNVPAAIRDRRLQQIASGDRKAPL
jgi:hypothetical protein